MTWQDILSNENKKVYFKKTMQYITEQRLQHTVYPPKEDVFRAFTLTPLPSVKVVILGQDPYHGPNEAHGLAFSVPKTTKIPPSLRNILTELSNDLQIPIPTQGDLSPWAQQGVLLLNTSLTVRHKAAGSHASIGWQTFTDVIIKTISQHNPYVIFVLWGKHAQSKQPLIDERHTIIQSAHPSPLSAYRGFIGSKPFSTINHYLTQNNQTPINWSLD